MKHKPLWKISVSASEEAEEAVVELMERVFSGAPSVHLDAATGKTKVNLYSPRKSSCTDSKLVALKAGLKVIRQSGLLLGSGRVTVAEVPPQDWAESWKKHFRPLKVGRILLVTPPWIRQRAQSHRVVVELDPGLSFGTGHHPTTRFCLSELVRCRPRLQPASLLDVGTGSGILVIAAAKLGYSPLEAFDSDPLAVRVARENTLSNGVAHLVRPVRRNLGKWNPPIRRRFNMVCANLSEDLLVAHCTTLVRSLVPGGKLVLAGIRAVKFAEVANAYGKMGCELIRNRVEGEWQSGTFTVHV